MRMELTPEQFHDGPANAYEGDGRYFKSAPGMARVRYRSTHGGHGELVGTWIACEEPEKSEGILESGLEVLMDSRLAPGASIGCHRHDRTEEIYYVLEGGLTVSLEVDGQSTTEPLAPGDSHRVPIGGSHWATAGAAGARFIVIAIAP